MIGYFLINWLLFDQFYLNAPTERVVRKSSSDCLNGKGAQESWHKGQDGQAVGVGQRGKGAGPRGRAGHQTAPDRARAV